MLLFPTFLVIWYITLVGWRGRIKTAENLEQLTKLKRQQASMQDQISYLKEIITQKVMNIPDTYLLTQQSILEEKLLKIEEKIMKYS